MSLLALFIISPRLSMGVNERIRQFAVLCAVGLTRLQVALVIAGESLVLAIIGWGGGLAAGWARWGSSPHAKPDLFHGGVAGHLVRISPASALRRRPGCGDRAGVAGARAFTAGGTCAPPLGSPEHENGGTRGAWGFALCAVNPLLGVRHAHCRR